MLGAVGWDGPDTRDSATDSDEEDEEQASTHSAHSATELIQAVPHSTSHSPHGSNSSPRGLEHKGVSTAVNLLKSSASVPTQVPQKVEQET
jgi:hypothetical protein